MFKQLKVPLIAFFLTFATVPSQAAPDANIDRLFEVSGIDASIDSFPKAIETGLSEEKLTVELGDANMARIFSHAAKQSLTQEVFESSIKESVISRLSNQEITDALSWYGTPVGQRVANANQSDQYAISQRVEIGARPQLSGERKQLIHQLDKIVMGSDNTLRLAVDTGVAMGYSMMTAMGVPVTEEQVREMTEAQVLAQGAELVLKYQATLAYTYESLSDNDLREYIVFMLKPESTILNDAMWNGISNAVATAGASMGSMLAEELQAGFEL